MLNVMATPETLMTDDDARWDAVLRRDAAMDGRFFTCVKTTGIYCRPSCTARKPLRENVFFVETREEAERAGFRACLRCRPDAMPMADERAELVAKACRMLEEAEEPMTLDALAATTGLSPFHFHRIFRQTTGVTPKAYADAARARRLRENLSASDSVTGALYEAGFGSSSRFYAKAEGMLGMEPKRYRKGGEGEVIRHAIVPCSLGLLSVAATARGICSMMLDDAPEPLIAELRQRFPLAQIVEGDGDFAALVEQAVRLVEAPGSNITLPLDVRGTALQQKVWAALRDIPPGETLSYAQLAEKVGAPKAVRAVASACAKNTVAVAIPCHRAVRGTGALAGYRWGLARKQALLERERKK
ncbi:bifunctional DNA-binding transcriptional regulator/O6-methylguanine-DNA methyltransferase Ada [Pedomonas mirosovicensis]|uniref:bifunctional DNA-binding transcriptional regulator/O6-methylguanine-DNA methyltransferase Ada n=1 Tax=Pedomonas mirosovicensis TaxID=2908641 RepID=UPI002168C9CF|nr:bifunctional DNA-binding transcriptional regulator/O6-methylguanine-DNA methyltransferase Ada [Pedomonas mirosovicensis]MCH8686069.1 bifunctional DNA-binding transcriptional regulator/O6-methylguanine-DNA methyltransferase Ada [Pedomonas mirosovicensis]